MFGLTGLGAGVVAFVLGRKAEHRINASQGWLKGKGMAQAGRILGVIQMAFSTLILVLVGVLVALNLANRGESSPAGEQITVTADAADTATLLAQARSTFGANPRSAQDLYTKVLDKDPRNVEALTYSGWLLYVASRGQGDELRTATVETAKQQLTKAVGIDATYADPHCFLAVIAKQEGDGATATSETGRCLANDPPSEVRALMQQVTDG